MARPEPPPELPDRSEGILTLSPRDMGAPAVGPSVGSAFCKKKYPIRERDSMSNRTCVMAVHSPDEQWTLEGAKSEEPRGAGNHEPAEQGRS